MYNKASPCIHIECKRKDKHAHKRTETWIKMKNCSCQERGKRENPYTTLKIESNFFGEKLGDRAGRTSQDVSNKILRKSHEPPKNNSLIVEKASENKILNLFLKVNITLLFCT